MLSAGTGGGSDRAWELSHGGGNDTAMAANDEPMLEAADALMTYMAAEFRSAPVAPRVIDVYVPLGLLYFTMYFFICKWFLKIFLFLVTDHRTDFCK